MISKVFSKFSSKLAYAKKIKRSLVTLLAVSGGTYYSYYLYRSDTDYLVDEFPRTLPVTAYRILPFCQLSRLFGALATTEIPPFLRKPIIGGYVKLMGCDLSEAKVSEVENYKSLSKLFQRQLKWDSRTIDRLSDMTSPCDGTVLYCGTSCHDTIDQVKGIKFTLKGFFGKDFDVWENKLSSPGGGKDPSKLFYVTIYLAPGDYHRFHSPTECELLYRRYFTGKLLSVNPFLARLVPGLFSVNERACYFGSWKHGLFTFTAVGATNVGNIRVFCDRTLPLNKDHQKLDLVGRRNEGKDLKICKNGPVTWEKDLSPAIKLSRGQLFGEFNLGSTIVLVFQAPSDFHFHVKQGDKVRMGTAIGTVSPSNEPDKRLS